MNENGVRMAFDNKNRYDTSWADQSTAKEVVTDVPKSWLHSL